MNLEHITYIGPELDEGSKIVEKLPENLISLLKQINGFVQYGGGLHVRGICKEPEWHSIESVIDGALSIHKAYPLIKENDIPFAEDCVGDQYLLRDRKVIKLFSETGEIEELGYGLASFFDKAAENPIEYLGMEPLLQLQKEGVELEPGQLINVYPPFCTKESKNGVSLKAIPSNEALRFLFDFSKKISSLSDGEKINVKVIE